MFECLVRMMEEERSDRIEFLHLRVALSTSLCIREDQRLNRWLGSVMLEVGPVAQLASQHGPCPIPSNRTPINQPPISAIVTGENMFEIHGQLALSEPKRMRSYRNRYERLQLVA